MHCDLKPDNVVLGEDGPRVIDFGIARALGVTETASSRVMGTTAYMAPERFRNDAVGPPCDVFAWAATMAFAAGGRPPFGNDSLFAVMHRVLHDPPELPALPPVLDELIRECLARIRRTGRPPSACWCGCSGRTAGSPIRSVGTICSRSATRRRAPDAEPPAAPITPQPRRRGRRCRPSRRCPHRPGRPSR
ncbi:protein kinase [Micromonospora sp. M12]